MNSIQNQEHVQLQLNVKALLLNMVTMVMQDKENAYMFAVMLQNGLDELEEEDAFGTEGQSDPRGDMRKGKWSASNVEGVDFDRADYEEDDYRGG
jgi:hypothetical protein